MNDLPTAAFLLLSAPLSALVIGFFLFHRRFPRLIHWPILASGAVVTAASWSLAWRAAGGAAWDVTLFRWIPVGGFFIDFGFRLDGLSLSVLAMVSVVSTLIHAYAVGYMKEDPGYSRFFLYFHLFFFFMVGLLISNNYLQMYLFWEGVGLASFLLIGFWHEKESARRASWKAFLTNRVGDAGFLMAILLMARALGTTSFTEVFLRLPAEQAALIPLVAGLLFWGASAKSAQFPLYVWLPDAMEGPTPVSALMHAATMVTAGVFLMARSEPLLAHAPQVAALMAAVGALTAGGAALIASIQKDLKRILAYSTVSHLGMMMLALGCGNLLGAVFHLITHGFFKALLFLCAGNVIHGVAHGGKTTADVDDVGALAGQMPWTYGVFLVGALALAGIPPLSGFFSKDLILESAFHSGKPALMASGVLIALGSSVYIFRMLFLTFLGRRPRQAGPKAHAHEAGLWMRIPVLVLAAGSALAGVLAGPIAGMLGLEHETHLNLSVAALGLGAAAAGVFAAYAGTMLRPEWDWEWRARRPALERILAADFGWQPFTAALAASVGSFSRWLAKSWEAERWDRFTESLADTCVGLSEGLSGLSRGVLNDYLWWMLAGTAALSSVLVLWR